MSTVLLLAVCGLGYFIRASFIRLAEVIDAKDRLVRTDINSIMDSQLELGRQVQAVKKAIVIKERKK